MTQKTLFAQLSKIPWFAILGLLLLLNLAINYAGVAGMNLVPFVIGQALLFLTLGGIRFLRVTDTSPIVFMTIAFLVASFLTWRNYNTAILEPSLWALLAIEVMLMAVTAAKMDVLKFKYGLDTALLILLAVAIAGIWMNVTNVNSTSIVWNAQEFLWAGAVGGLCLAGLLEKAKKWQNIVVGLQLVALIFGIVSSLAFAAPTLSMLP